MPNVRYHSGQSPSKTQPGGKLCAPPVNFFQTGTSSAVQLDATTDGIDVQFTPEVDFQFDTLSMYLGAIGTAGPVNITINAHDGSSVESNGDLNGSVTDASPTMTGLTTPSPNVVSYYNASGTTDNLGATTIYNLFSHDTSAMSIFNSKLLDNAAAVDKGGGLVGIPCTAHGLTAGRQVAFANTTNYNDVYILHATTSTDELVITETYAAETFDGVDDSVRFGPQAGNFKIHIILDLGEGNTLTVNKYFLQFPTAATACRDWTLSAAADGTSPDPTTEEDWTTLDSQDDQTAAIDNQFLYYSFTNGTAYRYFRLTLEDEHATYYQCWIRQLGLISAESETVGGTELMDWGGKQSGEATGWVRINDTETTYQFRAGVTYHLQIFADTGTDVSFAQNRRKAGAGADLNDGVICRTTTDGGTTWSRCLEDNLPAEICLVFQSTSNNVAKLIYGRVGQGKYIYLPDAGMREIPEAGVLLDCESLTVDTLHYAYIYDNAGTLTLDGSTTAFTDNNGIRVKTGATSRRLVGYFAPAENISTFYGAIDVESQRWIRNEHNRVEKALGASNPYTDTTNFTYTVDSNWRSINSQAFNFKFLELPGDCLRIEQTYFGANVVKVAISIAKDNEALPYDSQQTFVCNENDDSTCCVFSYSTKQIGLCTIIPIGKQYTGSAQIERLWAADLSTYGYHKKKLVSSIWS